MFIQPLSYVKGVMIDLFLIAYDVFENNAFMGSETSLYGKIVTILF